MTDLEQPDVHDMAAELTRPHQHRENYTARVGQTTWTRHHTTRVPSLLDQLQHAAPSGDGASRAAGYESRPAARLEALDALIWVDREASAWLRDLGLDDPATTEACVKSLAALIPSLDACGPKPRKDGCCHRHDVERDITRWWTQARIVTGWDTPAWRPDSTCPQCGVRGSLRVRLEERGAMCVECRETWDATTYQQLATHVRTETEDRRRGMSSKAWSTSTCWCPLPPRAEDAAMVVPCQACRSVHCRNAQRLPGRVAS